MIVTRPRLIASLLCLLLLLVAAILFALSRAGPQLMHRAEAMRTFDVQEEPALPAMVAAAPPAVDAPPEAPAESGAVAQSAPIAVTMPRIAYSYGFSFRLDRERIAAVQERHFAACRRLGPAFCRVTAMQRGGTNDGDAAANLKLQVAAGLADGFGRTLAAIAGEGGGETLDRSIRAEDLSRQMIDSDARIRTRELLIQRLTALLQTRSGNIEQAVEAERAINGAQEELEAARAALADMRGRVAMSAVEISYVARGPAPDSPNPIVQAFDQVASISASSVGAMIMIVGIALPWALLGGLVFLAVRAARRRRDAGDAEPVADISAARPAP
jgi:hypothetical protein